MNIQVVDVMERYFIRFRSQSLTSGLWIRVMKIVDSVDEATNRRAGN